MSQQLAPGRTLVSDGTRLRRTRAEMDQPTRRQWTEDKASCKPGQGSSNPLSEGQADPAPSEVAPPPEPLRISPQG